MAVPHRYGFRMKLSDYLKHTNTTPSEFAHRIGTSVPSVRRYLDGSRKPSSEIVKRIITETDGAVMPNDFWIGDNRSVRQRECAA